MHAPQASQRTGRGSVGEEQTPPPHPGRADIFFWVPFQELVAQHRWASAGKATKRIIVVPKTANSNTLMSKKTETNRELAAKFNVHVNTIRNWRKKHAPFGDAKRMALFIASQKNIPPDVVIHARMVDRDPAEIIKTAKPEAQIEDKDLGAAAALVRLHHEEILAHRQATLARESGDPIAARLAYGHWLKMLEASTKFERIVTEEMRKTNALVPKELVEQGLAALATACRQISRGMLPQLSMILMEEKDVFTWRKTLERALWYSITASEGYVYLRDKVPAWIVAAFAKDWAKGLEEDHQKHIEGWAQVLKQAGDAIANLAHDHEQQLEQERVAAWKRERAVDKEHEAEMRKATGKLTPPTPDQG
jgi:hypothetical protein